MAKLTITKDWEPIPETITFGSKEEAVKAAMDELGPIDCPYWEGLAHRHLVRDALAEFIAVENKTDTRKFREYEKILAKTYAELLWDQEAR